MSETISQTPKINPRMIVSVIIYLLYTPLVLFISSGQLVPDSRLPSVRELAGQLLVSLITVRRSYADLEAAGLIVRRQGYGTFVAKDVEVASRKRTLAEGRRLVAEAVVQAKQLGLTEPEIRKIVGESLARAGE